MAFSSSATGAAPLSPLPRHEAATEPVGLSWLVAIRWTTLLAGIAAVVAGRDAVDAAVPVGALLVLLCIFAASNVWLTWRVRQGRARATTHAAGAMVSADVLLLSWILLKSGGVLNPASVYYLVQIVLAALVLGSSWTWVVTTLSVAGYATLFLAVPDELQAAQAMHPEIGVHMKGMWLAFALTALVIGVLVTRLAVAVERRDRALETMRDRASRAARFAGLSTLAAGAAHELSTPLATIAVAARELERSLDHRDADHDLRDDARLIRGEIDRCRRLLDEMAGRIAEPVGEAPRVGSIAVVIADAIARVSPTEQSRVELEMSTDVPVLWPVGVVAQAVANLVQNGLQASGGGERVTVQVALTDGGRVKIDVVDRGRGMASDELARAGEPFFTTKPPGAGTGLGLFVARSAMEQIGGTLGLASSPNRGTTATIVLAANVIHSEAPNHG